MNTFTHTQQRDSISILFYVYTFMCIYRCLCLYECMVVNDCNKYISKLHAVYVTVVTYWIGGEGRGVGTRDHESLRYQVTCTRTCISMNI